MIFNKVINEAGAGHATTADFWTDDRTNSQLVRLNGNVMKLKDFLLLSKKNTEVQKIIKQIRMHKDFNGSIGDFILNLLKDNDGIIDISIKNGGTFFDKHEISRNKGE